MRLPLVVFVALSTVSFAAEGPVVPKKADKIEDAPKPKIVAPAAPTPAPKRSMLGRIFGKKPAPAPTPTPAPTPAPVVKPKPKPRAKPKAEETTEEKPAAENSKTPPPEKKKPETEKPEKPVTEPPAPAKNPEADKPATDKPQTDKPAEAAPSSDLPPKPGKGAKGSKTAKNTPKADKPAENLDDATKYKNAHATALEDEKIKDLKAKADSAIDDAEAHRASVAYNKALFRKIREIDSSLDGYVDKVEEAMMKRLEAEKH